MVLMEAPVVMVGTDSVEVDRRLSAGELVCPCGGGLARGGMPGSGRCAASGCCGRAGPGAVGCLVTHVLLAVSCLLRRADGVEVIGAALRREGGRSGSSADRGSAGSAGVDGAGLAARVRPERGDGCGRCSPRCWCSWTR